MHSDVSLLERQLRLLFRPNHAFCIHVDAKAPEAVRAAVDALLDCYAVAAPNAQIALVTDKPLSVYWGHIR